MIEQVLEKILTARRKALAKAKRAVPLAELMSQARASGSPTRDFRAALMAGGLRVIAEVKRASPSRGVIAEQVDVRGLALQYQEGGASAVSVLTEEDFFRGSLNDLRDVKDAIELPVLRKDFIFEPYQVWESRAAGADAILLIAAALDLVRLRQLILLARQLQLTSMVEVHDAAELGRAMDAGADVVGVNARNLSNFVVDLRVPLSLASFVPPGIVKVAESGIKARQDVAQLEQAGYDAILVGETLMRAESPVAALRQLID
jgi:indole-3-glycerol phosphate synthase